jgi:hypothetical protein
VQTRVRSDTAIALENHFRVSPDEWKSSEARAASGSVRIKATVGSRDFLGERLSDLICGRGSLVPEVGGQGVLIHRKGQGLCAYRAHRPGDRALAIVSKTPARLRAWGSVRKNVGSPEFGLAAARTTTPELSKGPSATECVRRRREPGAGGRRPGGTDSA